MTEENPIAERVTIREAVVIRPGDVLVVRVDRGASRGECADARELIKGRLPDLADVIVIAAEQLNVYRDPTPRKHVDPTVTKYLHDAKEGKT